MIKKPAYITIQEADSSDLHGIADLVIEEITNLDVFKIEDTEYYFVIKLIYDDIQDVQDVISLIGYLLIQEGVYRYTTTLNLDD